jgi:hypothetical protein
MLLHSLRALWKAPGGAGSIWKYLEALARATGVFERFAYGFRTELCFADGGLSSALPGLASGLPDLSSALSGAPRRTQSSLWHSEVF